MRSFCRRITFKISCVLFRIEKRNQINKVNFYKLVWYVFNKMSISLKKVVDHIVFSPAEPFHSSIIGSSNSQHIVLILDHKMNKCYLHTREAAAAAAAATASCIFVPFRA